MPGIAEMQESLRRVMREIETATGKKENAKKEAAELEDVLPKLRGFVDAENNRITGILRMLQTEMARVNAAERFRRRFEEDVRSILQGNKIKGAFSAMESAIQAVQADKDSRTRAASGADSEIRTLQAKAEDLKRKIREQEETGVQQ